MRLRNLTSLLAVSKVQAVLAQADPQTMAPLQEGYRDRVMPSTSGGVAQRWVLLYSEPRQPQAQPAVDQQWRKHSDQDVKAFKTLCRTAFACNWLRVLQMIPTYCSIYRNWIPRFASKFLP